MNGPSHKPGIVILIVTSAALVTWLASRFYLVVGDSALIREGPRRHFAYPEGGTGVTADLGDMFDTNVTENLCDQSQNLKAIIPIYSTTDHFTVRSVLRTTLGKWAKTLGCKIIFIVGVSLNSTVNKQLQAEYYKEKDILFMFKVDTTQDLNDKAVLMLKWISKHCANVPYAIHITDNTYINIEKFLKHMENKQDQNFILGAIQDSYPVPRNPVSKNYLTWQEYPERRFPPHLNGHVYAFPTRVAERLLSAVHTARYCWIEDVWLTGHVRLEAGVQLEGLIYEKDWISEITLAERPQLYDRITSFYVVYEIDPYLFESLFEQKAKGIQI